MSHNGTTATKSSGQWKELRHEAKVVCTRVEGLREVSFICSGGALSSCGLHRLLKCAAFAMAQKLFTGEVLGRTLSHYF